MKAIAVYPISNNMALQIFKIDEVEDSALVGESAEKAIQCSIFYTPIHEDTTEEDAPYFLWGEMAVPLRECIKV